jgi:hypothetical protein
MAQGLGQMSHSHASDETLKLQQISNSCKRKAFNSVCRVGIIYVLFFYCVKLTYHIYTFLLPFRNLHIMYLFFYRIGNYIHPIFQSGILNTKWK